MRIKCRYCDRLIDDHVTVCPYCGGTNDAAIRNTPGTPHTIQELIDFCNKCSIPYKQMRFFLGENYAGPKAFGIYEENGEYIVYKNKSDGSRVIRYKGNDEAYAVAQIYEKMKDEVNLRKTASSKSAGQRKQGHEWKRRHERKQGHGFRMKKQRRKQKGLFRLLMGTMVSIAVFQMLMMALVQIAIRYPGSSTPKGYRYYEGDYFWQEGDDWYIYEPYLNDWEPYDTGSDDVDDYDYISYSSFYDEYGDNGYGKYDYDYYYGDHGSDSSYDSSSWDNDWDDDWDSGSSWDYDWDSWDYDDTDWDSDW